MVGAVALAAFFFLAIVDLNERTGSPALLWRELNPGMLTVHWHLPIGTRSGETTLAEVALVRPDWRFKRSNDENGVHRASQLTLNCRPQWEQV